MQLHLLVVFLLVGQAAAWSSAQLPRPRLLSRFRPCARGTMRHHSPFRSSSLPPLAATSLQGGEDSSTDKGAGGSTSVGGGGGGVRLAPNEVLDGTLLNAFMQHTRESSWRMEDKTEKTLGKECE